jgi:hypothetical protein
MTHSDYKQHNNEQLAKRAEFLEKRREDGERFAARVKEWNDTDKLRRWLRGK